MNALTPIAAIAQSKFFLQLIDQNATNFHFRTFDDKEGFERKELLGNRSGCFNQHVQKLRDLNEREAGVFVVINDGGHSDKKITRIRAIFADVDDVNLPLEPIVEVLEPHFVIESSPGKFHVYWLVDGQFPSYKFKPIQKAIANKFGTDPSVV